MARQTIGEFLQTLRRANGYTQQEVADKLGISNKTLSSWETDRAYPDLLSIPALADLYGVTADEILRGERKNAAEREQLPEDNDKISDKYEKAALNNKFLKFNTQSSVLLIPSCAAALLIFVAMFLPFYVGLVVYVIGLITLITAIVLQILFYKNAFISAGITENEELTIWQAKFKMDIKYTLYRCLKIDGIVYLCLGALMLLSVIIGEALNTSFSDLNGFYWITAIIAAIGGIAVLISVYKLKRSGDIPLYTEKQYAIMAKNKKLLTKCIIGAVIPCVVIMITAIVMLCNTFTKTEQVYSSWDEQVAHHLQTLIVTENSTLHKEYGVDAAAYYFDLPAEEEREAHTPYYYYDIFEVYYSSQDDTFIFNYMIDTSTYINVSYANKIKVGDTVAYNVHYGATYITDNSLASGMTFEEFHYTTPEYSVELTDETSEIYTLYATSELYIDNGFIVIVWIGLSAVAIIIPTIIYFVKRKKVK